jgi:hypothetical protein
MGKKTKEHRARVAARNARIKEEGKRLTKAYLEARKAREEYNNSLMIQEGIKGPGFLELNGSDADKYQL